MQRLSFRILIGIILLAVIAVWIDLPTNPGIDFLGFQRDIEVSQGLDLQGGMQVTLEADVQPGQTVSDDAMEAAKSIIENRVNGLGVSEPLIQRQGEQRIIVELPGIEDPELAIKTFGQTGLLEFIEVGWQPIPEGQVVKTTGFTEANIDATPDSTTPEATAEATTEPTAVPTAEATAVAEAAPSDSTGASGTTDTTGDNAATTSPTSDEPVYRTIMTGQHLESADVGFDPTTNLPIIQFTLKDEGAKIFADYTANNVQKFLAITMDKQVISCPRINSAIPSGNGMIEGKFSLEEAQSLVVQLKYGSLPVPLKVVENRTVGPTLGQDSINKSLLAGVIGLGLVLLFMVIYYRLPGLLADIALLIYAAMVFALFKTIPITLTVPGIAGFILSIGMAVDANVLIFERTREELRAGKTLGAAIEAGFSRAWTSIRDSNISTLITCAILFWFGMNFGASIIKGFALTLGIGVLVSMFTAIVVTRTFLRVLIRTRLGKNHRLFANVD